MLAEGYGGLGVALNVSQRLVVKADSIMKLFRALPTTLSPPTELPRQINAESLISAELQRVYSAFLIMCDRVQHDDRAQGFTERLIFMFWGS